MDIEAFASAIIQRPQKYTQQAAALASEGGRFKSPRDAIDVCLPSNAEERALLTRMADAGVRDGTSAEIFPPTVDGFRLEDTLGFLDALRAEVCGGIDESDALPVDWGAGK